MGCRLLEALKVVREKWRIFSGEGRDFDEWERSQKFLYPLNRELERVLDREFFRGILRDVLDDLIEVLERVECDEDKIWDELNEIIDAYVPTYTKELAGFFAMHPAHINFITDVLKEYDVEDGFALLSMAYRKALEYIFETVLEFAKKQAKK